MKRILNAIMLFVSLPLGVYAEPISVDAIKVKDGDTIKVGRDTYRMVGYDTPEVRTARREVRQVQVLAESSGLPGAAGRTIDLAGSEAGVGCRKLHVD